MVIVIFVNAAVIILDTDDISIAVITQFRYKSVLRGYCAYTPCPVIRISHLASICIGDSGRVPIPVIGNMGLGALAVGDEGREPQHGIILVGRCITPAVLIGTDMPGRIQFQAVLMPHCIRDLYLTVPGIIAISSHTSLCIRFRDAVVVTVIGIGKGIAQGIRSRQNVMHPVISKVCPDVHGIRY